MFRGRPEDCNAEGTLREHSRSIACRLGNIKKAITILCFDNFFIKILKINTRNTFYRNFRRKQFKKY